MFDTKVIRKNARKYPELIAGITPRFLEEASIAVQADAKRNAPNKTGNLEGSITREVKSGYAIVGTNVEYAEYVEYGTRPHYIGASVNIRGVGWRFIGNHPGTTAQPFMRPAIDTNRKKLVSRLADMIRRAVRG